MNYIKVLSTAALILLTYACSHPIEIVGDGDVLSLSGNRDCFLEDYLGGQDNCTKNYVIGAYDETYFAAPRPGQKFDGWGNYCTDPGADHSCGFNFPANVVQLAWRKTMPALEATFTPITFYEDWQDGQGFWSADNGLWSAGTPTAGPAECFTGDQCAGTVLGGNYPEDTDSRLISPTIVLPSVTGPEELHLRFQQWFSYATGDGGQVQISVWDASSWGPWISEGTSVADTSGGWSLKDVDLTAYAGETVRLAFYHTESSIRISTGWYIDAIGIVAITRHPDLPGNFLTGWGNHWGADRGVWQVGDATGGPGACFDGKRCAGTVLGGNYPEDTDSRLISPTIVLPSVTGPEELHLRFQQWFSYATGDGGQVQISVWDASSWGPWISEGTSVADTSGGWSLKDVDLTAYAGETVRLAFYHTESSIRISTGWYIDAIDIVSITPALAAGFEAGWINWGADRGVWQVGAATAGPGACFAGAKCAGTVLGGNYPEDTDSRLISATLALPMVTGPLGVHLRFQQWFGYATGDGGQVEISKWDGSSWGPWISEGTSVADTSGGWSLKDVDLTAYAGETVRLAFYHTESSIRISTGWYIDDIDIAIF